jgi:hypothetical protein
MIVEHWKLHMWKIIWGWLLVSARGEWLYGLKQLKPWKPKTLLLCTTISSILLFINSSLDW